MYTVVILIFVESAVIRLSPKYQTLAVPVAVLQNIETLTHALFGNTIIFTGQRAKIYWTVRLNTGHVTHGNSRNDSINNLPVVEATHKQTNVINRTENIVA